MTKRLARMWLRSCLSHCLAALLLAASSTAGAQAFPSKPIRLIVGQPPGGPTDLAARVYADKMRAALGEQMLVENRPGAASQVAILQVAKADPDGYTMLYGGLGLATLPWMSKSYSADSLKDFTPISIIVGVPTAIAASTQMNVRNFDEFIADLRANPGKRNYANFGATDLLQMMLFKRATNTDFEVIRFNGAAPGFQAMFAGDVHFTYTTIGILKPLADAGKLRILVLTGTRRSPLTPDVPTILEVGTPDIRPAVAELGRTVYAGGWFGLVGPGNVPAPIVNTLHQATVKVAKDADFAKRMADFALDPVGSTPAEFSQKVREDLAAWRKTTQDLKYEAQ
jgi:tripartite-type tricarboxylate transporter receptor subunit TctC